MTVAQLIGYPMTREFNFAVFNVAALVLLAGVTAAWGRHTGRRLVAASGCLAVLAAAVAYCMAVRPSDIPTDWVTVLSHGMGRKTISHLYGHGANAGLNFDFVASLASGSPNPDLPHLVWLNLFLTLIDVVIFLHVAVYIVGPIWALPWTLAFALNGATFLASFSELPSGLLGLYFLAGVVGWGVLVDALPQPTIVRAAAYALCALLTYLVAATRVEVALVGMTALISQTAYIALGAEKWAAMWRHLRRLCTRPLTFLGEHPAIVSILCLYGIWLTFAGLPDGIGVWLGRAGLPRELTGRSLSGAYPFNPSIFGFFWFLPMLLLPLGVCFATVLGFVYAAVRFRRFGGLALSLILLARTYFAAQFSYFSVVRYLTYIMPGILLLGLFGKIQLDEITSTWRPNWRRLANIAYLMAWFSRPLPGVPEFYLRPEYHQSGGFGQALLDLNTQREVRYLISLTRQNPHCTFVGRVVEDRADMMLDPRHHGDPKSNTEYAYVIFGLPVKAPIVVPESEAPLDEIVGRYAPGAPCVRLYHGGDCNLNFSDKCKDFIAGRQVIEEYRFWSRPYDPPLTSGYAAPEVVLATYPWP